ncbi:hypothetical protein Mesil_0561 [Allomeiothermus silvanus DSM 9946]|uniref:Uncharacterized protein n=1 Tax=Allomeiothermus silvanus (strain ATCC 700542 / DSM 9946 / NBRC 106475 / NCIMB 13440 / VI-R2) TaxID=526227 RepID=D7BAG8_ALLS1|nr:hypothetical protein Mesil_0561 [Allomeiothermus silvanus DSM 9946]
MPRTKRWYRLEVGRLKGLLERLSLKDGLLLWEALGEDPRAFPLGKEEARRQAMHRIRRDKMSQQIEENPVTKCHTALRTGAEKPPAKKRIGRDKMSQRKRQNPVTKRYAYPDPAGALAQELGGWRAGLLFRARKEQNPLIQKLARQHRESLLELLNLAEGLPLPRRIPTTLAWLGEFAEALERLGDAEVQKVLLEVRKRGVENPLSYAAKVLASRGAHTGERIWTPTGEQF